MVSIFTPRKGVKQEQVDPSVYALIPVTGQAKIVGGSVC